ncbi:hypothetical protein CEUSTIGMA_g7586.t1 [Chlamydomonas eustigma]|uniref:Uncharacterized protein n=1 Tax=Chlamydomonas eustigma TaxID=1157962 RepID=A0A250XAP2_9CHLO|nr:hypothetical protein CEUSTIGMA_g7586.t1 [Chlamydomonas eustigma]|eukprot:GAX80148.1 hypothetical protein CEUSTIGMA_g7586.t1 [Chlamydomonas eustigma]
MSEMFDKAKRSRLAELEQLFIQAMKENKFPQALRFARNALQIQASPRFQQFIPLLEEKVAMDELEDDEDEQEDDVQPEEDGDEDEDDGEEEDSNEEEEEEEEEQGSTDNEEEDATVRYSAQESTQDAVDEISLDVQSMNLNKSDTSALRKSLQSSIQGLKEKDLMSKIACDDPLLSA